MPRESALLRAQTPSVWTMSEILQTAIANGVRTLNWQWGGQGSPPEPIVLPGLEPEPEEALWAGDRMTIDEMNARLGWSTLKE